jgi:hypothetical protein
LKPATLFGGDYSTYVLWAVTGDTPPVNLAEVIPDGDHAKLSVSTNVRVLGLIVTAEPHFLVDRPSSFLVLDTAAVGAAYGPVEGTYNYERDSLNDLPEAEGKVDSGLKQVVTAFQLAQRAGASTYAKHELELAENAMDEVVALSRTNAERQVVEDRAREAVRFSVLAAAEASENSGRQLDRIRPHGLFR